jgi:hypothetical protein
MAIQILMLSSPILLCLFQSCSGFNATNGTSSAPTLGETAAQTNSDANLPTRLPDPNDLASTSGGGCAGTQYGGYCWYTAGYNSNLSCNDVCAIHGGVNDATRNFAGSAGTDENCSGVLTALGYPNNTGPICGEASNSNGITNGPMPCVNACSASATHMEGCAIETWTSTAFPFFNGVDRARCTDAVTQYSTPTFSNETYDVQITDALACACNQ